MPPGRPRRAAGTVVLVGLAGLVVGVAATLGGVALLGDDESDDVDLACAALEGADVDAIYNDDRDDDGLAEGSRILGASQLFLAAGDGDFDSRLGKLARDLQFGVSAFDEEALRTGLDDAQDYCDDR